MPAAVFSIVGMLVFATLFYLLLALISVGLVAWRFGEHPPHFSPLAAPEWGAVSLLALAGCVLFAVGLNVLVRVLLPRWSALRGAARDIREWLGARTRAELGVLALASGFGEEWFFRGYLLNEVGLWLSSLIFGVIHLPPNRHWATWPLFAGVLGVALGALCLWTRTLVFAVLLHALINYLNLRTVMGSGRFG